MLNLVLFGAPGSGKGTQSAKLIDEYGLSHISTGDVLRDHIARKTSYGQIAENIISKGQLLPDEIMLSILEEEFDKHAKEGKGVVLDGFPRTIPQAVALREMLKKKGTELHAVIGLDVPEEELTQRLLLRGKDSGRADDNAETIARRLKVFQEQTLPLQKFYEEEGKYIGVNGSGVVDDIFNEISTHIEKRTGLKRRHHK
jgi:adenylate kinase